MASSDTERFQSLRRALVDEECGVFKRLVELPRTRGTADVFITVGELVLPQYFRRLDPADTAQKPPETAGAGLTRIEALWSALGEGIERYAASIFDDRLTLTASFAEVADRAVDPRDFILFSDAQYADPEFPFRRFDERQPRRWTEGTDLRTGERRLLPAQLVWMGGVDPDEVLCQGISTGLACGATEDAARFSALREVIERDAFMSTWLLRRPPPRIVLSDSLLGSLDPALVGLLRHRHLTTALYLLTTDVPVPVVLAIVRDRGRTMATMGAAAHPDARLAIRKAAIEAHHTWAWTQHLVGSVPLVASEDINSFAQHVRFYLEPEHQSLLEFLDAGEPFEIQAEPPASGLSEQLSAMARALHELGYRSYFVDLTSADIRSLGLIVGRALVPGLQPLAVGPKYYSLDDRRLRRVAAAWRMAMPATLNLSPHPFP